MCEYKLATVSAFILGIFIQGGSFLNKKDAPQPKIVSDFITTDCDKYKNTPNLRVVENVVVINHSTSLSSAFVCVK